MALIKCPECSAQISDKANACPSCGYPIVSAQTEPAAPIRKPLITDQYPKRGAQSARTGPSDPQGGAWRGLLAVKHKAELRRAKINMVVILGAIVGVGALWMIASNDGEKKPSVASPVAQEVPVAKEVPDATKLRQLAENAKSLGYITDYKLDFGNRRLDLTVGSMLIGDARAVGGGVCDAARKWNVAQAWEVRGFLPQGSERPAATCTTR